MSQITQEYTATNTYIRIISTTCELCGTRIVGDNWPVKSGDNIMEIRVSIKTGWGYGSDGGAAKMTVYDICPLCFTNKLEVWLREQGAKPRIVESEW
jgi:hypothetical protein